MYKLISELHDICEKGILYTYLLENEKGIRLIIDAEAYQILLEDGLVK